MIEVKHLTKKYGTHTAVSDLSFSVGKGKIYGFLGPNGAGKSTTMNIITGCLGATEGEVLIGGHSISDEPLKAKKHIGYLPEQPPLYTDMTPFEYLCFVAAEKGVAHGERRKQVEEVMEKTGLLEMRDRLIRSLSKGYRQRVGIAQALVGDPELIILDEPTVGLDPAQIIEIRDLIRALGEDHTVILSSHILSEVQAVCDSIMIISKGKLIASDTPDNLTRLFAGTFVVHLEAAGPREKVSGILDRIERIEDFSFSKSEDSVTAVLDMLELTGGKSNWRWNIRGQVDRMEHLVNQLVLLSGLDEKQASPARVKFSFTDLVTEELNVWKQSFEEKHIAPEEDIEAQLDVCGDTEALRQMLRMLLDNAVRYTPDDGAVHLWARREKNRIRLTIENSMGSVPDAEPEKLLERFTRGDAARTQKNGGTGIGLSAAKTVAEMHKGHIRVSYPDPHRFRVSIDLPAA